VKTSLNILCVDDHPDTVNLLRFSLEMQGHNVWTATTSNEAISLIQQREFDLYILDIRVPDSDGFDMCREIRARKVFTPIIIFSASASDSDKQAALDAGATMYVPKPEGLETILSVASVMWNSFLAKENAKRNATTSE